MPTVICRKCGARVRWRNTRGASRPTRHGCGGDLRLEIPPLRCPPEYRLQHSWWTQGKNDACRGRPRDTADLSPDETEAYDAGYRAGLEAIK